MKKLVIVLADKDEQYLTPLELKFVEELGEHAELIVISDQKYLTQFMSVPRNIDVLLINEELFTQDMRKHVIKHVFVLTETPEEGETDELSSSRIYKYTSVKEIYSQISGSINQLLEKSGETAKATRVILVYSPVGGSGKTAIALGLCSALAKCHQRVLYIDTNMLQSFGSLLQSKEYACNEFAKYLSAHSKYIADYLDGAVGHTDFDYILPFRQAVCSLGISLESYNYFIQMLREKGLYDLIIVDTSSDFTNEKSHLMSICEKVLVITNQNKSAAAKLDCLLENIDCSDSDKFLFICNRYKSDEKNFLVDCMKNSCPITEYISDFSTREGLNVDTTVLSQNAQIKKLAYLFV